MSMSSSNNQHRLRRGNSTSYQAKWINLKNVLDANAEALELADTERRKIVDVAHQVHGKIARTINDINDVIREHAGSEWILSDDGQPIIPLGCALQHNQQLLPDADNVALGVKYMSIIISGCMKTIENLLQEMDDMQLQIERRTLIGLDDITGNDRPLGLSGIRHVYPTDPDNTTVELERGSGTSVPLFDDPVPSYTALGSPSSSSSILNALLHTPRFSNPRLS